MHNSSYHLILKNIQRFIHLEEQEREIFFSQLSLKHLRKKEFLLQKGKICKDQFFVNQGCLKCYSIDKNGDEHVSMFAIEDYWTGDMLSFTLEQPSAYFLQALEDTEVLVLSKDNLELLYEQIPKFEKFFRILYQRSLAAFITRSNQIISLNAEEKYLSFKTKYPGLEQRISQKNIAAYIGVSPEFLSLLKKRLRNQ